MSGPVIRIYLKNSLEPSPCPVATPLVKLLFSLREQRPYLALLALLFLLHRIGVKYFISEDRIGAIGHEYQLIDDDGHPDARRGSKWATAALYDLFPAENKVLKAVGEFNQSRILVEGNHVEHWLNGVKVLEYELGSDRFKAAIAQSKFTDVAGFGAKFRTPILLQDHGDEVWFRSVKIRQLASK